MPRKKKEEVTPAVENAVEAVSAETIAEAPAAEKPKRGRRKKADAEATDAAPAKKTVRKPRAKKAAEGTAAESVGEKVKKTVARKPRKKAVVPNFVIQNNAEDGITYAAVVEKVQAAITIQDVTSLDIYVKAEEGKAYYVVNGEAAGAVDLF
jgi:hypothetical protein